MQIIITLGPIRTTKSEVPANDGFLGNDAWKPNGLVYASSKYFPTDKGEENGPLIKS